MIKKILKNFEKILIQKNVKSYYLLQDGLDKKEIFTLLHQYFDNIPDEIYDIYQWKNGTQDIPHIAVGKLWIIPMFYFMNLNEAIEYYIVEKIENNFIYKNFFPIFSSGGGDLLLIDITVKLNEKSKIYLYSPSNPDTIREIYSGKFEFLISYYDNLEKMIETIMECYNKGAYFFNEYDGYIDIDENLHNTISKELNPNSDYWKIRDDI